MSYTYRGNSLDTCWTTDTVTTYRIWLQSNSREAPKITIPYILKSKSGLRIRRASIIAKHDLLGWAGFCAVDHIHTFIFGALRIPRCYFNHGNLAILDGISSRICQTFLKAWSGSRGEEGGQMMATTRCLLKTHGMQATTNTWTIWALPCSAVSWWVHLRSVWHLWSQCCKHILLHYSCKLNFQLLLVTTYWCCATKASQAILLERD